MKHEFGMKLQRYYNYFNINHPYTRKKKKKKKKNPTIHKQLLQNQEALESSTVEHMHSHKRHGIQVVHSQPPGVCFLHNLLLFTTSFLVSQARPTFAKKDCAYREAISSLLSSSLFRGSGSGLRDLSRSSVV